MIPGLPMVGLYLQTSRALACNWSAALTEDTTIPLFQLTFRIIHSAQDRLSRDRMLYMLGHRLGHLRTSYPLFPRWGAN